MRILLADPLGAVGHRAFNDKLAEVCSRFADVTYAADAQSLDSLNKQTKLNLLKLPHWSWLKLGKAFARLHQIRKLTAIQHHLQRHTYDRVIFLAYETVSFAAAWNRNRACTLIHHNNLDELCRCPIRRHLFSGFSSPMQHFVFCDEFADMLRMKYGFSSQVIPHPYYHSSTDPPVDTKTLAPPYRIYAPSRSGYKEHGPQLLELAHNFETIHVTLRGEHNGHGERFLMKTQFDDYHAQMQQADAIFCGGRYHYRVSGVAYEALALGKPVFLWDGPFANSLRRQFPSMVHTIQNVPQIAGIMPILSVKPTDQSRFLTNHHDQQLELLFRKLFQSGSPMVPATQKTDQRQPTKAAS